jgi:uncharacterized protein YggE
VKRYLFILFALCLFCLPALAEDYPATLSVIGTAGVSVLPDSAQAVIGCITYAETVEQASAVNTAMIASVSDALTAMGLTQGDIATNSFNVFPRYDYSYSSEMPDISSYQVEHMLNITVRDLDSLGAVLDAAMKAGANQSYGISFYSSCYQEAADEALKLAVADAYRKAELTAAAAGMELDSLVSIQESTGGYYMPMYGRAMTFEAETAENTSIYGNSVEISVVAAVTNKLKLIAKG